MTASSFKPPLTLRSTITWHCAMLFVIGGILGGGVLTIGNAVVNTGWVGFVYIFITFAFTLFNSTQMADACSDILDREEPSRNIYLSSVYDALGTKAGHVTTFLLHASVILVSAMYLIVMADMTSWLFVNAWKVHVDSKVWMLILTPIIIPLSWLNSPKDIWWVPCIAVTSTAISVLLISYNLFNLATITQVPPRKVNFVSLFTGVGTITGCFAGMHLAMLAQHDTEDHRKFKLSLAVGFLVCFFVYCGMSLISIGLLGDNSHGNVLVNMIEMPREFSEEQVNNYLSTAYATYILLAMHFFMGYVQFINILTVDVELAFGLISGSQCRKNSMRTFIVLITILIAIVCPHFDVVFAFNGGVITPLLSYVIPALVIKGHRPTIATLVLSYASLAFGAVVFVGCVIASFAELF